MKKKASQVSLPVRKYAAIAGVVSVILVCAPRAESSVLNDLFAGPRDLLRAHSERMVVFFGADVKFKRYRLVSVLDQHIPVLTDAQKNDYSVRTEGGERTLTIY
jgi:hypothetical protein